MTTIARKKFEADLNQLSTIRQYVQRSIAVESAPVDVVEDVIFATNEIATNIIVHGYEKQGGSIEIEVETSDEAITVRLRDNAPVFDPTSVESADITRPLEQRPLGKLGLFMTQEYMDVVQYNARGKNGNEITLIKYR